LPAHADPLHWYGAQVCVWTAGQLPAPSQLAASVATPLVQEAPRHCDTGNVHAVTVTPSHEPPHDDPSLAHAARTPCGAPTTGEQVPTLPATSQAWHWPSHATSQQTPSTHSPLPHWLAPEQAAPSTSLGAQMPAAQ
jgi:hypothetical protein